ncbi:MAG: metal-dependent transcriptional regulator [Lachnospiraceae bacterium]|jgi:Mn-dependent DtxR family transcriptional regulator|nr:metal-dependent transcriptional regulator [Lachnospiraceae bacterium]MDD5957223.1 metal-dependent transcriptional regulator [Lachnospiraceae bacterium]MDY3990874.1 metal-dependent transcriptional regulator [Lachnospiraceae bacterium]
MKMQESAQDYLESILILSQQKDYVRATDICNYFGYARATVSVFMKQLKENGYVDIDEHNHITLTDSGMKIAQQMYERHQFLSKLFIKIGVPEDIAVKDACRVEHYVSAETFEAMKKAFSDNKN